MRADECRSLPWVDRGGAHLDPGGLFLQPKGDAAIPIAPAAAVQRTFPAGGVDLRAFMRRLPARDFTREVKIDHRETPPPGAHAYWIRVTQEDGAQAWTSPVYLREVCGSHICLLTLPSPP